MRRIAGALVLVLGAYGLLGAAQQSVYIQTLFDRAAIAVGQTTATINGTLTTSTTSACTAANTTETALWTYSLPANSLNADGRGVRVTVAGVLGANANTKTVRAYFGGTVIASQSSSSSGSGWQLTYVVLRTGSATQIGAGAGFVGSAQVANAPSTPSADTTSAITIKVTGQNGTANANDICFKGAIVESLK